jgi:CsoR family transcriptional regulator, copper-sensing transcriptional repressor
MKQVIKEPEGIHIQRINKIIGQLKGIQKMLAEKRDCTAVLLQIGAIKAAVNNLGLEIAKSEVCNLMPEHKEKLEAVLKEIARI